jgi:hypothetical protein
MQTGNDPPGPRKAWRVQCGDAKSLWFYQSHSRACGETRLRNVLPRQSAGAMFCAAHQPGHPRTASVGTYPLIVAPPGGPPL